MLPNKADLKETITVCDGAERLAIDESPIRRG